MKKHWIFAYKTLAIVHAHISGHAQKWNAGILKSCNLFDKLLGAHIFFRSDIPKHAPTESPFAMRSRHFTLSVVISWKGICSSVYVHIYRYMHLYTYLYNSYVHTHVITCVRIYVCTYIRMYVRTYVRR